MKKLFTKILLLLIIALFISCDETDDTGTIPTIEGIWQLTGMYDYTMDKFSALDSECSSETTIFKTDGTGTTVFTDCVQGNGSYPFLWEKHDTPNTYNQTIEDIIYQIVVTFEHRNKMYVSYADDAAKVYERFLEE